MVVRLTPVAVLLGLALLIFPCRQAAAGEKYALLVGCSRYELDAKTGYQPHDLDTPPNDVAALYYLLQTPQFGFKRENIRVLLSCQADSPYGKLSDGLATTQKVVDTFNELFRKATSNDLILFAYSGHGTHLFGHMDEPALELADYATNEHQVLTFAQLRGLHARMTDGQSVFLMDSCNSGGLPLATDDTGPVGWHPLVRSGPPFPDTQGLKTLADQGIALEPTGPAFDAINQRTTTITACQAWEVAADGGPQVQIGEERRGTGVLTGYLVQALSQGAQNQTWEDVGRSARFLSVLGCVGQTVGVSGHGLAAMPFSVPHAPAPTPPTYYVGRPDGKNLAATVGGFLGDRGLLAVYRGSTPAGEATEVGARIEPASGSAIPRLVCEMAADGPRAVVLRQQDMSLRPLGVFVNAHYPNEGRSDALSRPVADALAPCKYVQPCSAVDDPHLDYTLDLKEDDEDTTWPTALAGAGAGFPCDLVQGAGRPPRSRDDSVVWMRGILHYLRAVQGAAWTRNHASPFRVWVSLDKPYPLYHPGDTATATVTAKTPCFVVLMMADSLGNVTVVVPPKAVSPDAPAPVPLALSAEGVAGDMHLAVLKVFAFAKQPPASAVTRMADEAKTDPADAMVGLLQAALGASGKDAIPTDGWADNEAFLTIWRGDVIESDPRN